MLNILHANSSHCFHKCMSKEVHQIYDTLKLMEQQEDTKKIRSQKRRETK
ncbi:hypothetical protein C3H85_03605 [Campylobacter jejuni]|nr:hypothetical protein [Campylobacter jejuni]RTI85705.1 hypothetical protein C3I04_03890 [Campylobacter jejuni]RTJ15917.1 hypothetical protein C3H85_03605 [Campylobacter jejuni]